MCVSTVRTIRTPRRAASASSGSIAYGRVDDRGDARFLVADQIRRTAEVVVNELLEQHEQ